MKIRHIWITGAMIAAFATWLIAQAPLGVLPGIITSLGTDNAGNSLFLARFNGTFNYASIAAGLSTAAGSTGMSLQYRDSGGNPQGAIFIDSAGLVGLGAPTVSGSTLTAASAIVRTTGITTPGYVSNGTKFTASGCSNGTTVGGATAGRFTLGANTCTVIITMNGATGLTAPNGWSCSASDRTAPTVLISQTADSTTTASLSVPAGAGTTDVISFRCDGY